MVPNDSVFVEFDHHGCFNNSRQRTANLFALIVEIKTRNPLVSQIELLVPTSSLQRRAASEVGSGCTLSSTIFAHLAMRSAMGTMVAMMNDQWRMNVDGMNGEVK
jgi:hypothetical protein